MPCSPLALAAEIRSSGLETPSPEKNECVCRSILMGTERRLVWTEVNAKYRFQGVGRGLRSARARPPEYSRAQGWHRRRPRRFFLSAPRLFSVPDLVPRTTGQCANH